MPPKIKLMGSLSLILIALMIAGAALMPEATPVRTEPTPVWIDDFQEQLNYIYRQIEKQNKVDIDLHSELHSGAYTPDDPLVVIDPYGLSPLTAVAVFETEEAVRVSVLVKSKTQSADISFDFEGYSTEHIVPIYGLYVDQSNIVVLTLTDKNGRVSETTLDIHTDALPERLEKTLIKTYNPQPEKYNAGLNFSSRNMFAYDINGDYRWMSSDRQNYAVLWNCSNGTYLCPLDAGNQSVITERNMLGKYLRILYAPSGLAGIHHDIEQMPNGNLLITTSSSNSGIVAGDTIEDIILEIDADTGKIANVLDFTKILDRSRYGLESDWCHMNKVTYSNGSIIVSCREQNTVVKLSYPEGKIQWILGTHDQYSPYWQQFLLSPLGDNFEWPYRQHYCTVLPDGDNNADTMDVMVFDNGWTRFDADTEMQRQIRANEIIYPENYTRMVIYRVNEKDMSVEQIWQYGKGRGTEWYAYMRGSAMLLPNGNRIGNSDVHPNNSSHAIATEVDERGSLVWEAYITTKDASSNFGEYRTHREPIYRYSDNDLHIGEHAVNLIPQNILGKYGFAVDQEEN